MSAKDEKELEKQLAEILRVATSADFLAPVGKFLADSATWPREVLEARYAHERAATGAPVAALPRAPHRWFREATAYELQTKAYHAAGRTIPPHVYARAHHYWLAYGYMLRRDAATPDDGAHRADDPRADAWTFPPEVRVTCTTNPFQRGDAWTAGQLVEQAGAAGIAFEPLAQLLTALGTDVPAARARAARCFTEHVRDGKMKLLFDFGNPAAPTPV